MIENLKKRKTLLEQQLRDVNNQIKQLHHKEMLEIEAKNNLTIGCKVEITTRSDCPANYASVQFLEYLGIEDPYRHGYHQIKIGYKCQGCHYHTFHHNNISEIERIK